MPSSGSPWLVSLLLWLRRSSRRAATLAAALGLAAGVVADALCPGEWLFRLECALLLALVGWRAYRRTRALAPRPLRDFEIGVLLVVAAFAVTVHVDRQTAGRTQPLVYVAIAAVSSFSHPLCALGTVLSAVGFEAALQAIAFGGLDRRVLAVHGLLSAGIALVNLLSLRIEVARLHQASRAALAADRERIRQEARSYRLLRPTAQDETQALDGLGTDERLIRSGVEEIRQSVLLSLRLLHHGLGLYTAMLLWLGERGKELRIRELCSDAEDDELSRGPFSARDGIFGAALAQREPVSLGELKPSYLLPHYQGACPVQAVLAVPLHDGAGGVRGLLLCDRRAGAFSAAEEGLCAQAALFAAHAIDNERVLLQLDRTRVEQAKLYRAAERLGAAIGEEEVVEAGVCSASEIAAVDFAALTAYEPGDGSQQIRAARGQGADGLLGRRFPSNGGLCAMALQNRHCLPYRGQYEPGHQVVFAKELAPPPLPSLLVLPLMMHGEPLGTLVLGSRRPGAFDGAARSLLDVLASHLAVSLSNARMVRRLEEQATTDGLTGLLNKRALIDTAEHKLSAARRFGRQLSVLICDIDHFKNVNDRFGHDVGDVVIKALGQIHQREKRATDAVARFGGEEFVTICDETDAAGALLLAERIRNELKQTSVHSGAQAVSCSCSIGIATFPQAGRSWPELFKAADEALYASKRGGRDRVTIWEPLFSPPRMMGNAASHRGI